jgi:hypothetical protein
MRLAFHNWFLRFAALLIFISGGALARAVVQEIELHFVPSQHKTQDPVAKAVHFESRQPLVMQLDSALAMVQATLLEFEFSKLDFGCLELASIAIGLRAYDALAPPETIFKI